MSLPNLKDLTAWVEFTHERNRSDQPGYRLGEALWSPAKYKGKGLDRYGQMRQASPNDIVIHVVDRRITGYSRVAEPFHEQSEEPPNAGQWSGMSRYYVVPLKEYCRFEVPIELALFLTDNAQAIRADMNPRSLNYPFQESGKGHLQASLGGYLKRLHAISL